MKKISVLAIILALSLLSGIGLAETGASFSMMGLEGSDAGRTWSENLFFQRMQEKTGISFTIDQYVDSAAYQAAKDAAFAGGSLPDVLFKANLSPREEMAYLASGQLVDLAPYLEEYAPTVHTILEAREDWRAIITQPNGAITSLPILNGAERQCCIWINRVWLDALGLAMPTTIEEYTDVLRAFRNGDPNGNGKQDEVPLSIVGPWEAKYMLHAWGIVADDYNIFVDDAGVVRFAPFEPGYREFVEWLAMAQSEALIGSETFRQTQGTRTTELSTMDADAPLTYGGIVSTAPYTMIDIDKTLDYAVIPPLTHDGQQVYRLLLNGVGRGAFAITSACEDIPAALQWVDKLYTEEIGRLAFAGLEGEDYTFQPDGTWKWEVGDEYYRLNDLVTQVIIAGDSLTPGLEPAAFMRNSEIAADNYARRQVDSIRDTLVEPFPVTWPTDEAREERIAALQAPLAACVDTAIANFAMGKIELNDDNWNAFLEELNTLGVDEFLSLWQAKYDEVK